MGNTVSATAAGNHSSPRLADPGKELLRCAEQGNASIVSWILACDAHYLAHSSMFGGNTAWHKAAKAGRVEVLEAMEQVVKQQFALCRADGRYGLMRLGPTPEEVVKRLANKANLKGITPLMLACTGCHTETVAWLLKHGADVWRHDRVRRHTALHCAAESGATDAIRMLLATAEADVHPANGKRLIEQGNHAGLTPLMYAVYCDHHEVMHQLLAADADISVQAEFPDLDWGCVNAGDTAMHIAAYKGNIDSIQILLRAYNEKSGSILPDTGVPRRLRDPRAMRNDFARLPYHLAMRKGFNWLAEMLDPSVPVRYILAGEQLGTDTTWGPPRLATIAAAVLHQALMADLALIKELAQADAMASAAGSSSVCSSADTAVAAAAAQYKAIAVLSAAPHPATAAVPSTEAETLSDLALADVPGASAAEDNSSDATAGQKRRWTLALHRRSNSFGTSSRPSSRGTAASDVPSRPPSRRQAVHSRRGSRGAGEFGPPPSPLSPRVLMSVMLGGSSAQDQQDASDQGCESAAVSPKPHLDDLPSLDEGPMQLPFTFSKRPSVPITAENDAVDCQQHQHQDCGATATDVTDSASVADTELIGTDWEDDFTLPLPPTAISEAAVVQQLAKQSSQQQLDLNCTQQDGASNSNSASAAAVQLVQSSISSLLKQCRWDSDLSAGAPAPVIADDSSADDSCTCGVCLDAKSNASIVPCKHTMCADCALDMCERFSLATAVCPFCRCFIQGFTPTNLPCLTWHHQQQQGKQNRHELQQQCSHMLA